MPPAAYLPRKSSLRQSLPLFSEIITLASIPLIPPTLRSAQNMSYEPSAAFEGLEQPSFSDASEAMSAALLSSPLNMRYWMRMIM